MRRTCPSKLKRSLIASTAWVLDSFEQVTFTGNLCHTAATVFRRSLMADPQINGMVKLE